MYVCIVEQTSNINGKMLKSLCTVAIFVCLVNYTYATTVASDQCCQNEVPTSCYGAVCERRFCSDLNKPVSCVRIDPVFCTNGCLCKSGYLRDDESGICVPIDQCPNQCGQNEVPTSCYEAVCEHRLCSDLNKPVSCVRIDPAFCTNGCLCKSGYLRDDESGICVPIEQCPNQCGQNEVPTSCYEAVCESRLCSDLNKTVACVRIDPAFCTNGCLCKSGYLRDDESGICVPIDQCPNQCGQNEVPTSCYEANCERRFCSDLNIPVSCVRIDPAFCTNGCLCKSGYLRDENGICVPIDQCPNIRCGENEIFDVCPAPCPGERCGVDPTLVLCAPGPQPGDPDCNPGCRCQNNYFRNEYGFCVPKDQCPKTKECGPNEVVTASNNLECRCRDGWLRTENGTCVPAEQCPPKPVICGVNEEYSSCVNGGCYRWNCSQPDIICVNLKEGECREGCRCKKGFLRAEDGTCIPADQCPLNCYGQNEVAGCQVNCPPQTCESIDKEFKCPPQPEICKPECRCKEGYFRNKIGQCISKSDCLKCTGPNEYFTCGGVCDNVCATLATQNQTSCRIVNVKCNPKCYCLKDYARDFNNTCIPISECPAQPVCGNNEIYDVCPATCPPKTCDALGRAYKCKAPPQPGDPECKPGCRCNDGYYKNKQGVCVPKNKCPKPVNCGPDEEYNSCVNGGCGRWNCSQPGIICIRLAEGACREGCRCKEGLLRTEEGTCVPADQCPLNCYGENEVRGCKSCSPQTCDSIGKIYNCPLQPAVCTPECRCKNGFFRNQIGACVSQENCNNSNTNELKDFEKGNVAFTEKFLYEAALANPGKSLILSPFSFLFLLAQLALYATGTSLEQLLQLLNLDSKAKIRSVVPDYLDNLGFQKNVTFSLVEKIYANWNYVLSEDFKKDTADIFKAEAQNLDFCKSSNASEVINEWVALNTNNLIQNLVSPDSLNCDTALVMVNAIYFKANWKYKFDPANSRKADFYVDNTKSVQVNMMRRSGSYKYAEVEDIDAQVIELPYKSDNFSLLICLPKRKESGITDLLNNLKSNYSLTKSLSSLKSTQVDVSIPSFNSTTTTDMKELLMKLKEDALFSPKTSGLTGILKNSQPTYVSSAVQKAGIIVNELGSEAAAANAIVVGVTSVQLNTIYFTADHAFVYYILYKGTPIFCGIYYGD